MHSHLRNVGQADQSSIIIQDQRDRDRDREGKRSKVKGIRYKKALNVAAFHHIP